MSIFSLEGKTAIVTGSGRGIGKAIALGLAEAGADVVVTARTASEIDATAREIRALGRKALALPADTREREQVVEVMKRTKEEWGRIDVLVSNAGGHFLQSFLEMSEKAWDAIIRENLKSVFLCGNEVGRIMREQGSGSIINMASIAGLGSYSTNASYGAAKAAIISLTKTMAIELGRYNVRVNAVTPGIIETAPVIKQYEENPEMKKEIKTIALGRLGKPAEVVGACIFLASEASSYVTGASVVIDGGLTSFVV